MTITERRSSNSKDKQPRQSVASRGFGNNRSICITTTEKPLLVKYKSAPTNVSGVDKIPKSHIVRSPALPESVVIPKLLQLSVEEISAAAQRAVEDAKKRSESLQYLDISDISDIRVASMLTRNTIGSLSPCGLNPQAQEFQPSVHLSPVAAATEAFFNIAMGYKENNDNDDRYAFPGSIGPQSFVGREVTVKPLKGAVMVPPPPPPPPPLSVGPTLPPPLPLSVINKINNNNNSK
eukprot:GHVR01148101.1.p1 GENE.GHVR01148101.1~~GHVR01148101.1.p1  ORF type:complete len:236 (+),score=65.42 GHVR01148101.1:183-890(+)